jgi:hypothetical protein
MSNKTISQKITISQLSMRRWTRWGRFALLAIFMVACGQPTGELTPGQTDFVNEEPEGHNNNAANGRGEDGLSPEAGAGNFDSSKQGAPPPGQPPQGRTGTVEEADIYRVDNNRLFYLNTYRGFIIYDLNDPKKPRRISRLPVYGYPIEMFVDGNTVYALIKDALYLTQVKGQLEFKRHNVSQLVTIDVTDLEKPRVLKTVDIIGQLREGVSRKIDDTIYVVSYIPQHYYWGWSYQQPSADKKEQAWVYSFNVANAKDPQLVDKLKIFEGGSYSTNNQSGSYARRYFRSVAIGATSNALMVVENWRRYGRVSGSKYDCSSYVSLQEAVVSIIDISDPKGKIHRHTKFTTYGELTDQFKHTYVFDKKTGKGTYLGIFARREWNSFNCQGTSFTKNTLEAWDVTDGAKPKKVADLPFGKENETVRGSTFDRDRKIAYAITARNIDPLYAISFADPQNPKLLSEIDGLSGDMNVFRLINNNQFLIGIGRDNSDTCTGFGSPTTGWSSNVAVSIIDVRDPNRIRLVQRQCVAVKNAHWVGSQLNWNRDQAHKMIGMHSDDRANVITVPVYYHKKSQNNDGWWWYQRETAVGLMTWDLSKYDDTKDHLQQNVLQNFGTLVHENGQVRRSIVYTHKGQVDRRMVLNLSDTHLSHFDIEDLDKPVKQSVVEVAPYYQQIFRFGNYMVEHVGPHNHYYYDPNNADKSEFRIKKAGGLLEDAPVVARFSVGQVHRVVKHGNKLVLFRLIESDETNKRYYYNYYKTEALVMDLSNPEKPVRSSVITLPYNLVPYYHFWCGDWGYRGGYWFDGALGNWITVDNGLVFLSYHYDYELKKNTRELVYLDLSTPTNPAVKQYPLTTSSSWPFMSLVPDAASKNGFYLSYRAQLGKFKKNDSWIYRYKYYAQRYEATPGALKSGTALNLPGRLIRAFKDSRGSGRLFLTHDYFYIYHNTKDYPRYQANFRLNLLRERLTLGAPSASLLDSKVFTSLRLEDLAIDGSKLFINARHDYYSLRENNIGWQDQSDYLMAYDLSGDRFNEIYNAPTGTYNVRLMGTNNGRLFVNVPGDGVLVVDINDPTSLFGLQFLRTLGYATHLEFSGNTLYVASGYFGIYQLDLGKALPIPFL